MDVRDVVLRSAPTVEIDASLRQVADMMARAGATAVLVVDEDGNVLGVVTEAVLAGVLDRMVENGGLGERVSGSRDRRGLRHGVRRSLAGRRARASTEHREAFG